MSRGRAPNVLMVSLSPTRMLHMFQQTGGSSKAKPPTPQSLAKHKLTKQHYIRPIIRSLVASATIFTAAGLAHVLEDDKNKRNPLDRKTEWSLIAANALVFGCWRLKGLQRFMKTHFMHRVESERYITLLSACFSHRNVIHFAPNMALLYYFLGPVQELSSRHEVVAVYLSSGIFGFAASHTYRYALYRIYNRKLLPSMGASGALTGIMAVAYSWLDRETHLSKTGVFRDVFVFQVVSDAIGIMFRVGIVDFAAHLGGAIFGYLYASYGHNYIWHPLVSTLRKLLSKESNL